MIVLAALRVPERAPLFTIVALANGASAAAVGVRLVAEGTIVPELIRAVLPAHGTNTVVTIAAPWIAQSAVLLLVGRAGGNRNTDTAAIGLHPATLSICVAADHRHFLLSLNGHDQKARSGCKFHYLLVCAK